MGNLRLTYRNCVGFQPEDVIGPSRFARNDGEGDPGDDDGHSWNNPLAHATFYDNVDTYGKQAALTMLRQDIRSFIREKKGEKTDWSLKFDGTHLLMEDEEMQDVLSNPITHANSILVDASIKDMVPYEISTFREAENQIARGAKQVILPEHHAMANGDVGARFLTVLTQDEVDPTIFHGSRVDLKSTTRITEIREKFIEASKDQKAHDFHESDIEKNAFILSSKSVRDVKPFEEKVLSGSGLEVKLEMTHKDIQRSYADMKPIQENKSVSRTVDAAFSLGGRVVRDGFRSTAILGGFLIHAADKKIQEKREKEKGRAIHTFYEGRQSSGFFEKQQRLRELKVGKQVLVHIHKKFTEFIVAKKILMFVQSGVGVGAGIFALEILARELPKSFQKIEKKRTKMLRRIERDQLKQPARQGLEKDRLPRSYLKTSEICIVRSRRGRRELLSAQLADRRVGFEMSPRVSLKDVSEVLNKKAVRGEKKQTSGIEKKRKSKKEKRILLIKKEVIFTKEKVKIIKKEKKLRFVIGVLLQRMKKDNGNSSHKEVEKMKIETRVSRTAEFQQKELKMQRSQEKVMVLNFSFAFSLWMLFFYDSKELRVEKPSGDKKLIEKHDENKTDEKNEPEEVRPWILFSIIYYLAMIRESGARHSPQQKAASRKKSKKQQRNIPQSGVIFTFSS